ncbi:negative regulator of systemic acquired resistance SNI1 [Nymphaea colorata]|nr:negative regulator of systemic acquired resistance SNI1 [Nymphaea colorata]
MGSGRGSDGGGRKGSLSEENLMAMLESSGCKDVRDLHEDRLSFLEGVRSATIIHRNRSTPTWKMYDAVFQILKDGSCLELTMASYKLLVDLEKCYPRVYLPSSGTSASTSSNSVDLVIVSEAWSPFNFGSKQLDLLGEEGRPRDATKYIDPMSFFSLTQSVAQELSEMDVCEVRSKTLSRFLLLNYLIIVLEVDFLPRYKKYKETLDWDLLKECLINLLLGSRRINFKNLIRECLSIISKISYHHGKLNHVDRNASQDVSHMLIPDGDTHLQTAIAEYKDEVCTLAKKFLIFIMELDNVKKEADMNGLTTRTDGSRLPLVEIIVDELTYNKELVPLFLEGFTDPKWKLEIILQYFWKYCTKSLVRTRRSNNSTEDGTLTGLLQYFLNGTSTKTVIKKLSMEIVQLLLAHAFQAFLSIQIFAKQFTFSCKKMGLCGSLVEICKNLQLVFASLKKVDEKMEIIPFAKEALFTAAVLSSGKC